MFLSSGQPLSSALENTLFYPPPRITLKLKMPKCPPADCKNSSVKTGSRSGLLVKKKSSSHGGSRVLQQGSPDPSTKYYTRHVSEQRSNGLLGTNNSRTDTQAPGLQQTSRVRSSGKPLSLQAVIHGQSSNGGGKVQHEPSKSKKSNGLLHGDKSQKDNSSQTLHSEESLCHLTSQSSFRKSSLDHFNRSFKEATNSLVRTMEDIQSCEKPQRRQSTKDRLWNKQPLECPSSVTPYQDNDGYCPDLELSDSEAESDENKDHIRVRRGNPSHESPSRDSKKSNRSRIKKNMIPHSSGQR